MAQMEGQWLERNKYRSYPFPADNYAILLPPYVDPDVDALFLDAYLTYADDNATNEQELTWSIWKMSLGTGTTYTITLLRSDGVDVALTVASTKIRNSTYVILSYISTTYRLALTLILDVTHPMISDTLATYEFSPSLPLIARANERQPDRVETFNTENLVLEIAGSSDELLIEEGNNIQLDINPVTPLTSVRDLSLSPLRPNVNRILISAIPGAGAGLVDTGCNDEPEGILTINGTPPLAGNFNWLGDNCYSVTRPVTGGGSNTTPNTINIDNQCVSCCDCADFSDVLEGIRDIKNEGVAISAIWDNVRAAYEDVLAAWGTKVACVGDGCRIRIFAYSFTGWLVTVQVWVGNVEYNCTQLGVVADVSFSGADLDPVYVDGSGTLYNSQNTYQQLDPTILAEVFTLEDNSAIDSCDYKLFTFSVRMDDTAGRVAGNSINVNVTVTACGGAPVTLQSVIELKGNFNKG